MTIALNKKPADHPNGTHAIRLEKAWTLSERLQVSAAAFLVEKHSQERLSQRRLLSLAQQVLVVSRHRDFANCASAALSVESRKLEAARSNPGYVAAFADVEGSTSFWSTIEVKLHSKPASVAAKLQQVTEPTPTAVSPVPAPPVALTAYPPLPAPTAPGPLERALQQVALQAVQPAFEQQLNMVLTVVREELTLQREHMQHLLMAQYDSLMSYWDPEYKRQSLEQAAYVPDPGTDIDFKVQITSARIRRTKILVSGGQTDQFHPLRMHFKGIDFEFIDGRNPRQVSAGGFYDLVVCTKYTNHPARDALIRLHGNKVVVVDGAITNVIATIKQRLGL